MRQAAGLVAHGGMFGLGHGIRPLFGRRGAGYGGFGDLGCFGLPTFEEETREIPALRLIAP